MIGALIGDIVGSIYEFNNIRTKDFPLLKPESRFTDDSVMTLAVAEIMQKGFVSDREKIVETLKKWGKTFINAGYGESFIRWLLSENQQPYGSYGNGAAMRVSPVAWYADSAEEVKEYARAVTRVTHNHPEGLKGAEVTAMCIYYARIGYTKDSIRKYAEQYYDLNFDYDELRKSNLHDDESCQKTVPQAIYCFVISDSFEDCIRTAVSIGGDCDTVAAISGSIAEAYYKKIDRELMLDALSRLPTAENGCDTLQVLSDFASRKINVIQHEIKLTDEILKNIAPDDVKALKVSAPGSMGKSGEICLISGNKENLLKYQGNLAQLAKTCDEAYSKLTDIKNHLHIDSSTFAEIYMGLGNFLYISKKLERSFDAEIKNMCLSEINCHCMNVIWRLLKS